jgi:general secretion pathway protein N
VKRAWLKYALVGLLTYALALIVLLPAQQAYGVAQPYLARSMPVTLHDLGGSVWSGRAGTLAWRSTPLGALQWELSPWQLLQGRLGVHWQLQDTATALTGHATVRRDGGIALRDVAARFPAAQLMLFNPGLPIAADGTIAVKLDEARLQPQAAPALRGTVVWSQALLVAGQPLKLGDLRLTLQPAENGGSSGAISDGGGPLEISGTVVLDANRSYRLDAKLRARPGADAALGTGLQLLGRADARGYHTLRYSGRL